jgi:hypothetical protein
MKEFAKVGRRRFIERMINRAQRIWPEECARFGGTGTCKMVESAVEGASAHQLVSEYDVARFVDLVFAFESVKFDRTTWAADILEDVSVPPRRRMNRLWEESRRRLTES